MAQQFNIAALMQEGAAQFGLVESTTDKIDALASQFTSASDALVEAVKSGTDARGDTALSLETRKLAELEAQKKKAETYKAMGMDAEGNAKITNRLAEEFQMNTLQALEQSASIQERSAVGLLDNPLGWAINQLILPDEKNALDATLKRGEAIKSSMNQVNNFLQQTSVTENEYAEKLSTASIDSQTQGLKSELEARAARTRMEAISQNSHMLQTVMTANKEKFSMISAVITARNTAEQMQLAREAAGRERQRFDEWIKDNKEKDDYVAEMTKYVNAQEEAMGRPLSSAKEVELALKGRSVPEKAKQIQLMAQAGYINSATGGVFKDKYGETPTAALDFTYGTRVQPPPKIAEIYSQANTAVKAMIDGGKLDKNNKAATDLALNAEVAKLTKQWTDSIDAKDGTNPYVIPDTKVMATNKMVQDTELFQKVLAVQVRPENGLATSDPNVIIEKGLEAVKEGKMSFGTLAQDLVTYFRAGVEVNNINSQFHRYGMPEQRTYNAKVSVPNIVISDKGAYRTFFAPNENKGPQNLTDLVAVNRLLVKKLAASSPMAFNDTFTGNTK